MLHARWRAAAELDEMMTRKHQKDMTVSIASENVKQNKTSETSS